MGLIEDVNKEISESLDKQIEDDFLASSIPSGPYTPSKLSFRKKFKSWLNALRTKLAMCIAPWLDDSDSDLW